MRESNEQLGERIAETMDRGMPLVPVIRASAEEVTSPELQRSFLRLAESLEQGDSLQTAIGKADLPDDMQALAGAGSSSEQFAQVLRQFLIDTRTHSRILRKVSSSIAYAVLMLGTLAMVLSFFTVFMVPDFKEFFADFGVELPAMTLTLVYFSDFMVAFGWYILLGVTVFMPLAILLLRFIIPLRYFRGMLSYIPIIGRPFWLLSIARFSKLLNLFIRKKMPLPDAIRNAAHGTQNIRVEHGAAKLAAHVEAGYSLASAPRHLMEIPWNLLETVAQQESDEALPDLVRAMGDVSESRGRSSALFLAMFMEPVVFAMMGFFVGYLVIGLYLPLVKFLNWLT